MNEIVSNEVIDLKNKIINWQYSAGESFTDYFMHDSVADNSWAFWLLGKGYNEKANEIIQLILDGETCIDQETLYDIFPEYIDDKDKWSEENHHKNIELWSEFLLATPIYTKRITEFLDENS